MYLYFEVSTAKKFIEKLSDGNQILLNFETNFLAGLSNVNSTCPQEYFGFQKKLNMLTSNWPIPGKKVHILKEWFTFREVFRRKIVSQIVEEKSRVNWTYLM